MRSLLFTGAICAAVAIAYVAPAAIPPIPPPPPLIARAARLVLEPADTAIHLCPSGYLLSLKAVSKIDQTNVETVFVDRGAKVASDGVWLPAVAGFRLARPYPGRILVDMICS